MQQCKKVYSQEKNGLHPRNKHRTRYNLQALCVFNPELAPFVRLNDFNNETIDFSNAKAVLMLNRALLKQYYGIGYWDIPDGYLCPPVPGRADYIHNIADLLSSCNNGVIPTGTTVNCLDIGVGANCIYPIIGVNEYGWAFTGSDIEPTAIKSANKIIEANACLKGNVKLRTQVNPNCIFGSIVQKNDFFDVTICNPPFHSSYEEAKMGSLRKLSNLNHKQITKPALNFGGKANELWCKGGEERFVQNMILESKQFASSCFWFSTLISKQSHLKSVYYTLKLANAIAIKTIPISQGNKISRIVAWTFLTPEHQLNWQAARWNKI